MVLYHQCFRVDCCELSKWSLKRLQCWFLHGKELGSIFMDLSPFTSVDELPYHSYLLLTAVLCCVCLGIPKHSGCLGLTSPLWASLRQRSLCGPVVQVHRQHTLNQTEVAGHCGRDTSKLLFSFLLLILFISESVNGKNLAVSFDMSEWALLLPVADFHLEQNNLQSPAWGREMLMDKVTNITVQKHSCFLKNYLHDVFGGWWIAYVWVLVISQSYLDLPSGLTSPKGLSQSVCWE